MNERAAYLSAMVLVGATIVAAFPGITLIVILYVTWRAYVLLNPDKINHETAVVLRKTTQFTALFMVGLVLVLLVLMSQSPIPTYIEFTNTSYNINYNYIPPELLTFNPGYALMYILTGGRPSIYLGGGAQTQSLAPLPTPQPEATPESLG